MSLKHTNFENSAIMQEYVKIALNKGLIKQEQSIVKEASTKKFEKLNNFNDKILSLCSKLRGSGFDKYADDIEQNFLNYKLASTQIYDVSGETGEDLVDQAHPDGGKEIIEKSTKDMGVVETITEQQKKMHDVVFKKPTGKLALNVAANLIKNADENLNESDLDNLYDEAKEILAQYSESVKRIQESVKGFLTTNHGALSTFLSGATTLLNLNSLNIGDICKPLNNFKLIAERSLNDRSSTPNSSLAGLMQISVDKFFNNKPSKFLTSSSFDDEWDSTVSVSVDFIKNQLCQEWEKIIGNIRNIKLQKNKNNALSGLGLNKNKAVQVNPENSNTTNSNQPTVYYDEDEAKELEKKLINKNHGLKTHILNVLVPKFSTSNKIKENSKKLILDAFTSFIKDLTESANNYSKLYGDALSFEESKLITIENKIKKYDAVLSKI